MEKRYQLILSKQSDLSDFTEICARYGVTPKTGYKWWNRYEEEGLTGLQDRSRAPHNHPNEVPEEVQEAILAARRAHPTWGPKKLRIWLARTQGEGRWPALSTIGELLKRNGLSVPRKRRNRATPSGQPFAECEGANQLWCADYKGWFRTADGSRCDPLTITDGFSRYLLRCQTVDTLTFEVARGVFEAAFREYGLPDAIRTDNGAPFASTGLGGLSRLSVWWLRLGIEPQRIEPAEPQQNGRHERMHLTLKQETANPPAQTLRSQQKRFDAFRQEYNAVRPHEGIGFKTPTALYQPSTRPYPARLGDPEYGRGFEVRRIGDRGEFRWGGRKIGLAYALEGQLIGLQPCANDRYWRMYFGTLQLGIFDAHEMRVLRAREAARRAEEIR